MKKVLIAIVIACIWLLEAHGVSYWGWSIYNIPDIVSTSWQVLRTADMSINWYPSLSAYQSWSSTQAVQTTFWFRINTWTTFSGMLLDIRLCSVWLCEGWTNTYVSTRYYYNAWSQKFHLEFNDEINTSPERIITVIFDSDSLPICYWLSSDCIVIFVISYVTDITWTRINTVRYYNYNDISTNNFWYSEIIDSVIINPSLTSLVDGAWWLITNWAYPNWYANNSGWILSFLYWWPDYSAPTYYVEDSGIILDYLSWLTIPSNRPFTTTAPLYYGSSWSTISSSWTTVWSGIFDECWTFEIGCYLEAIWNQITWFFDSLFPEISFSGNFNSCWSGTSSSWTYMQKIANMIAIINPIPPEEWEIVCTPFGSWAVHYQSLMWTGNFFTHYAPTWLPSYLYWDGRIFYDQTILDVIVIFVCIVLIFYQRKND